MQQARLVFTAWNNQMKVSQNDILPSQRLNAWTKTKSISLISTEKDLELLAANHDEKGNFQIKFSFLNVLRVHFPRE